MATSLSGCGTCGVGRGGGVLGGWLWVVGIFSWVVGDWVVVGVLVVVVGLGWVAEVVGLLVVVGVVAVVGWFKTGSSPLMMVEEGWVISLLVVGVVVVVILVVLLVSGRVVRDGLGSWLVGECVGVVVGWFITWFSSLRVVGAGSVLSWLVVGVVVVVLMW